MDDKELRKHQIYNAITLLLIWVTVVVIAFCIGSCRSVQTETVINYRDSVITHHVTDTTRLTITDTLHVETSHETGKESETEIQFGEGGGTYNALTGEATNVANLKQSSTVKELQKTVTSQAHTIDYQAKVIDSLCKANRDLQETIKQQQNTKEITPRSRWDKFCTWWTVGSWILLILLAAWWAFKKFYLRR